MINPEGSGFPSTYIFLLQEHCTHCSWEKWPVCFILPGTRSWKAPILLCSGPHYTIHPKPVMQIIHSQAHLYPVMWQCLDDPWKAVVICTPAFCVGAYTTREPSWLPVFRCCLSYLFMLIDRQTARLCVWAHVGYLVHAVQGSTCRGWFSPTVWLPGLNSGSQVWLQVLNLVILLALKSQFHSLFPLDLDVYTPFFSLPSTEAHLLGHKDVLSFFLTLFDVSP